MIWIKNVIIVILVSLFTLKIADITFGFFIDFEKSGSHWNKSKILNRSDRRTINLREFDPGQKAIVYPTDEYLTGTDSLRRKGYNVTIDRNGFIENGNSRVEDNLEKIKLLFLGGSTTEAIFVTEEKRFTSIIERNLSSYFKEDILTQNAGVSGNNSMHSLIKLLGIGIKEQPFAALMMHNINDLSLLYKNGSYWDVKTSQKLIIDQRANEKSTTVIKIFRFIKSLLAPNLYHYLKVRLFPNFKPSSYYPSSNLETLKVNNSEQSKEYFKSSITSFVEICKAWNIKPILLTQFNRIRDGDKLFERWTRKELKKIDLTKENFLKHYQDFNDIVRLVANENGVELIDLDKLIPKDSQYMYDVVHLNDEGSVLVANIISARLIPILKDQFP